MLLLPPVPLLTALRHMGQVRLLTSTLPTGAISYGKGQSTPSKFGTLSALALVSSAFVTSFMFSEHGIARKLS